MKTKIVLMLFAVWMIQVPVGWAQSPATITFATNYFHVSEAQTNAFVRVWRFGDTSGTVSVHYATSDGTATAGLDYTATSGTLTFAPDQGEAGFNVPIIFDDVEDPFESVNLTLSNPTGGAVLGFVSTSVFIIEDSPPFIQIGFSSQTFTVSETDGSALVTVLRQGSTSRTVTVHYATSDGLATAGLDYIPTNGTLTFGPGETVKTFSVPVLNDGLAEWTETVNLTLNNPSGGATLGGQSSAVIYINDAGVRFAESSFQIAENAGVAEITVTLGGTYTNVVALDYATSDGTAKAGVDYTAISGTLTFLPGQTNATFSVPIVNDSLPEGTRTANLTLVNPTGASLSVQSNAMLYINDNDFLSLASPSDVNENDGTLTVNVRRTGDTDSPVTVVYFTRDGAPPEYCCAKSAKAGMDYLSVGGSVTFVPGETNKTFAIPILDKGRVDGDRVFTFGLIYGSNFLSQAQITIHDNEIAVQVDPSFNPGNGAASQFFGNGQVLALAVQPDGRILIGGSFDTVEDVGRTNIARLNADGSLDTNFVASTSLTDQFGNAAQVTLLTLQANGQILLGGNFTTVNGVDRVGLARLNPDGSLDANFNATITLTNQVADSAKVNAVVVQPDGKIIIGGTFDTVNGIGRTNLARLKADGSLDTNFPARTELIHYLVYPWDPLNPVPVAASVSALALQPDGNVIVGGEFVTVNGAERTSIARLNQNGSLDDSFFVGDGVENGDNPGVVRSIFWQSDGTVVLGGQFSSVHGVGRVGLARLNWDGSLDGSFNPVAFSGVEALTVRADGAVFIAQGRCSGEGGCYFEVKQLNPDGSLDDTFPPVSGGGRVEVMAIEPDGNLVMGGSFQTINLNNGSNPVYRPGIARLYGNPNQPRVQFASYQDPNSGTFVTGGAVTEIDGTATLPVQRLGDTSNALSVDYATSDGTAKAGVNYVATNGTLRFAPLESTKTITIPILRDGLPNDTAFHVTLSNPTGGALLSGLNIFTVTIHDSDFDLYPRISGTSDFLRGITYGDGLFVAGGESVWMGSGFSDNMILTSPDGINWTPHRSGVGGNGLYSVIFSITHGHSLFVAVGAHGQSANITENTTGAILTSPDGLNWMRHDLAKITFLGGVTYGNGLFIAVGDDRINGSGVSGILTSPDGVDWTQRYLGTGSGYLFGITRGDGLFVAVGYNPSLPNRSVILTSPDGITWTPRNSGANSEMYGITYGNGLFVAVGYSVILTSPDGITWTQRNSGANSGMYGITFGNGLFVAVGHSGVILTSPDGITWTQRNSGTTVPLLWGVAYGNGSFAVVGSGGTILQSQPSNPRLEAILPLANGAVQITLTGLSALTYQIQGSTDLTNWIALTNLALTNGTGRFFEHPATNVRERFYRGVQVTP